MTPEHRERIDKWEKRLQMSVESRKFLAKQQDVLKINFSLAVQKKNIFAMDRISLALKEIVKKLEWEKENLMWIREDWEQLKEEMGYVE